jgi:hypothetical protein
MRIEQKLFVICFAGDGNLGSFCGLSERGAEDRA